jgi:hypothetical protein
MQGFNISYQKQPEYDLLCKTVASVLWGGGNAPFLMCAPIGGLREHDVGFAVSIVRAWVLYIIPH